MEEITVNGNGKQKVALDYKAIENTDYEFKIKPVGKAENRNFKCKKEKYLERIHTN